MPQLHIQVLGALDIRDGTGRTLGLPRKVKAVLAFLALNPDRPTTRETLASLFWPNVPDAQARSSLRQALTHARRAFEHTGLTCLHTNGERIVLHGAEARIDAVEFETLALGEAVADLEAAVALYAGDLLEGHSVNAEAFEDWLRAERARLRALAVRALERLTTHHYEARRFDRCTETAARLLTLDPLREDIHRLLMRTFAGLGQRAQALRQYESCREALKGQLSIEPEAETRALASEIRARRLTPSDPPSTGQVSNAPPSAHAGGLGRRAMVAILPFGTVDDPAQAYLADGLTEGLITELTRFSGLFVIGAKSALAARGRCEDACAAGRALQVSQVVVGGVRRVEGRVRVRAQLLDVATGRTLWAEHYDRPANDLLAVEDEITAIVAATLAGRIETEDRRRAHRKRGSELDAYDLVLRGRHLTRQGCREALMQAREHFERARQHDPGLTAAHVELALSYVHEYEAPWCPDPVAALDKAFQAAMDAVRIDEGDSLAHRALAYACHYLGRDSTALSHIERASELNPHDYSVLCLKSWILTFGGRVDQALVCLNEALRLNPWSQNDCLLTVGIAEYGAGRYEAARAALERIEGWALLRDAGLAACYGQLHRAADARRTVARLQEAIAEHFGGHGSGATQLWLDYVRTVFRYVDDADFAHLLDGLTKAGIRLGSTGGAVEVLAKATPGRVPRLVK